MQAIVQGEKKTSLFINALIAYTNNRTQDLIHLFGRKFEQAKQLIDRFWGSLFQATKPVLKPKKRNSKPIETGSAFNGHNFNDIQQAMEEDDDSVFMRSPKKLPIRYRFSRPNSQNTTSDDEGCLCTLSDEEKLSVASTAESSRLRHLEMELIELRKQMATLLANQGVAAVAPPLLNAGISDANTKRSTVANTRTASTAPPPPPPPPPPPVFLKSHSGIPTIKANDLQQVKLNHLASGDRQRPSSENKPASRKMAPSLTEVLKELNTVQLKKLPKSPGGTPLVRSLSAASPAAANKQRVILNSVNREHFQSSCDQGSFLADALRNKFKNVRLSESFNEQENDCSTDEEDLWNE
uniref:Uncharacterized protein n=1 Tax=Acrobeloides nanus TaxID=290746 RepID=A0A914EGX5_9BILA